MPRNKSFLSCFTNVRKHSNKLTFPLGGYDNLQDSPSHAHNNARPPDNDILLSRWKTPASPAYFEPSVRPLSPRVLDSKGHIWSAFFFLLFFFKPPKEVGVNRNLLSLWDVSFQAKLRWMTGTPASPAEPRYWPRRPGGEWIGTWKGWSGAAWGRSRCCRFAP